MPRISSIDTLQQNEQPTLVIRSRTNIQGLPQLIGASMGKMAAYLEELGEMVSDMPFVAYHTFDMKDMDVEIGFPLAKPLPGKDDIQAGTIPAGIYAFCMYLGPYNQIGPVYEEIMNWIGEHGYAPVGPPYECYYNGPEVPGDQLLTRVSMGVVKK